MNIIGDIAFIIAVAMVLSGIFYSHGYNSGYCVGKYGTGTIYQDGECWNILTNK